MTENELREAIAKAAISAFCYVPFDDVKIETDEATALERREQWVSRATADAVSGSVLGILRSWDARIVEDWPSVAEAIRRLYEISQLAQGLLFEHGAFGQPWPDSDLGKQLTAALEARTLPHDWERVEALIGDDR